ncbi:MAG: hypothetical protein IJD24_05055 [Agathobacter sp.]|nr:hypothetical protein [Agathobacter sp.]
MKYFKQFTLIILSLLLLLSGCGNSGADDVKFKEKPEYSLSEYLNSGETIWYQVDGTGKDAKVKCIYVLNKEGAMYYCKSDWSIGEAEQMEDEAIISFVKDTYSKNVQQEVDKQINRDYFVRDMIAEYLCVEIANIGGYYYYDEAGIPDMNVECELTTLTNQAYQEALTLYNALSDEDEILYEFGEIASKYSEKYNEWLKDYLSKEYQKYLDNIQPMQYKLSLESDSTGNNTNIEMLVFQESIPCHGMIRNMGLSCEVDSIELKYINPHESNKGATNCFEIYDSWYGGYRLDASSDDYFVTRVDSPKIFRLDEIGTEGITIDVKDIDTLFDTSILIDPTIFTSREYSF